MMKKTTIILFILLPIFIFSQKKETIFISYIVPLNKSVDKKLKNDIKTGTYRYQYKEIPHLAQYQNNSCDSCVNKEVLNIFNSIIEKANNNQLTCLKYDWRTESCPVPSNIHNGWLGEKLIIDKNKQRNLVGYKLIINRRDNNGDVLIDDNGENITWDTIIEYDVNDFFGFKFWEEWEIDYENIEINKKINYYALLFKAYNPVTDEMEGYTYNFYFENKKFKKGDKILKNYQNSVIIKHLNPWEDITNFSENNIESSKRLPLAMNILSTKKTFQYFKPTPPYNQPLKQNLALGNMQTFKKRDWEGEIIYNKLGEPIYYDTIEKHTYQDIKSLGFLEDWFFDYKSMSFRKEVKGILPERLTQVLNANNEWIDRIKPIYLKKQ